MSLLGKIIGEEYVEALKDASKKEVKLQEKQPKEGIPIEKFAAIYYIIFAIIAFLFVSWLFKNLAEGFRAGWNAF